MRPPIQPGPARTIHTNPARLWGRAERTSVFLFPHSRGVETSEARSGVAHREQRERCAGWGLFRPCASDPHPTGLRPATLPASGRIRKSVSSTSNFKQPASHPHLRDLAARDARVVHRVKPSEIQRARGMPGARCTRSLAWEKIEPHEVVATGSPEQSGIPRAMVLRLIARSSR